MHTLMTMTITVLLIFPSVGSAQGAPTPAGRLLASGHNSLERQEGRNPAWQLETFPVGTSQDSRATHRRSRAPLIGTLVGLAAGTALAAFYWTHSNCQYGSDAFRAIVTHCMVPSGVMIGGGALAGLGIGKAAGREEK